MAEDGKTPEFYSDSLRFSVSPYGVAFTFGVNPPHPNPGRSPNAEEQVILRMSLEQAKVLAMLLRRQLKTFEGDNDIEIPLPPGVYTQLGIAREDWL